MIHGLLHGTETTLLEEVGAILSLCDPIFAEIISDGVVLIAIHRVRRVLNPFPVLGVELLDLRQLAGVSAIVGDELSRHSDWLRRVHLKI